jgi:hypothetical protein
MFNYVLGAMLIAGAAQAQTYNPYQFNPQPPQQTIGGYWNPPPPQTVIVQPPPTYYPPVQNYPSYLPPGTPGTPSNPSAFGYRPY